MDTQNIFFLILGIALGKLADYIYQKWRNYELEKALLDELRDIKEHLEGLTKYYDRTLQMFALGGFTDNTPLKLYNPIFRTHYVDVALKLNACQRKSFSYIQAYTDVINKGIDRLEHTLRKTEVFTEEALEKWGEELKIEYGSVTQLLWHIDYHLKNKSHPFVGDKGSDNFKLKNKYLEDKKVHIKKLIEEAREHLSKSDFD